MVHVLNMSLVVDTGAKMAKKFLVSIIGTTGVGKSKVTLIFILCPTLY